jgi:hypothetical protein
VSMAVDFGLHKNYFLIARATVKFSVVLTDNKCGHILGSFHV